MLKSLLLGIGVYAVIGTAVIIALTEERFWNLLGFVIGILLAAFMVIQMSRSIDISVHQEEDGAVKHTRIMYVVRMMIIIGVLISMVIGKYANPVAALLGLFSLKFSAYFQLITIKYKSKGR